MYHTPRVVVYVCEEGKCGEPHMAAGSEIGFLGKLLPRTLHSGFVPAFSVETWQVFLLHCLFYI